MTGTAAADAAVDEDRDQQLPGERGCWRGPSEEGHGDMVKTERKEIGQEIAALAAAAAAAAAAGPGNH